VAFEAFVGKNGADIEVVADLIRQIGGFVF